MLPTFSFLFSSPEWIVSYSQIRNKIIIIIPQVKRHERRHNVEDETDGSWVFKIWAINMLLFIAEPLYNYDNPVDQEN